MSKFFPLKLKDRRSSQFTFLSAIWLLCFAATDIHGQSVPEAINYQAIVRDAGTFLPISDQGAYVSIEFLDGPSGDVLYQEEFPSIQTGKAGLINLSLGQGDPMINSFGSISWESGNVWLRLSVDIGNGLNILQETPFNTVPYAFYAKSSGSNSADGDVDSSNELIEEVILEGANLIITEGDQTKTVDLNSLRQDADADPLNEIQDLSLNVSTLTLTGDGTTVDLSSLPGLGDDADADPSNEIQDLSLNVSTLTLTGDGTTVDLSSLPGLGDDADADPLNEIQDLSLNVSTLTLTGDGTTVDLSTLPGLGNDADADPANEIQDLSISGSNLSLTGDGTSVDLSPFDQTDLTDGHIFVGDGSNKASEVDLSTLPGLGDDADADPSNEIQDLSLNVSTLTLTGDGTTVDLSSLPGLGDDADADPANEIQDLSISGSNLSLTGDGTSVDLSPFDQTDLTDGHIFVGDGFNKASEVDLSTLPGLGDDADADPLNEIQDLSLNVSTLTLTGDGTTVDLSSLPGLGDDADADPSNEIQDLSISGSNLSLTGDGTSVDLSPFDQTDLTDGHIFVGDGSNKASEVDLSTLPGLGDDADADPQNEIQDLSLNVSTLTLTGDGTTVDLSSLPGLGDDADADPQNEIQDLSISGSNLSLTGDGTSVDLSPFDQSVLSEGYIFVGNGSDEASEVEVFGDIELDSSGESKVRGIQGTDVSGVDPTDGQVLVYNDSESEWQPATPSSVSPSSTTEYYSLDPLDFRELTDNVIGVDLEVDNALKFFDDDAPFAMLRNTGIIEIMAPIHLPHGSTIDNLKVYFKDSAIGDMLFTLYRKNMTNFSVGNEVLTAGLSTGLPGDGELDINIFSQNIVDNATYSYRLYVRFTSTEGDDEVTINNVDQRVYGAVIEYTTN